MSLNRRIINSVDEFHQVLQELRLEIQTISMDDLLAIMNYIESYKKTIKK